MARIRTVKPEYFRHELLQDLERDHPALKPMLVFAGLWTQCDKNGVFEYKPRQLKLDILPFLDFDIASSIGLLIGAGMVKLMSIGGSTGEATGKQQGSTGVKVYGYVPTFQDHQRINGKEKQDPARYPQPTEMKEYHPVPEVGEALGKQQGSTGEATGTAGREGKGKEEEGKATTTNVCDCFEEKREWLAKRFPSHDLDFQKEKLLTKYPRNVADPWLLILNWFETLGKGDNSGRQGTTGSAAHPRAEKGKPAGPVIDGTPKPAGYYAGDFPDRSDEW